MNIKKIMVLPIVIASLTGVSAIYVNNSNNTVKASTEWQKGTPKAIRGTYITHKYGAGLWEELQVTSTKMNFFASGMSGIYGHNVRYKVLGKNKFILKYDAPANGMFNGGKNLTRTITKIGKNVHVDKDKMTYYKQK